MPESGERVELTKPAINWTIAPSLCYASRVFTLDLNDLHQLVTRTTGHAPASVTPMPGGASSRKFFRVGLAGSPGSCVAMFVPDLAKSDEIAKDTKPRRWPFLEVRDLLAERGVRVPALVADGTETGWTLVEDLGDDTLAEYLIAHPDSKPLVYETAVRDLARAQNRLAELPEESIVRTRAFDFDLLRWELDHFREWGLDALDRPLPEEDRFTFDAVADRLARRIASFPRGFTHRDYQSRNIMVVHGDDTRLDLAWVDFQDALMGPSVYDLVALLNDSYQTFDRAFVEQRLADYAQEKGLTAENLALIVRHFDLVTVQRKLKDAGRFVFIDRVKKDPSYLQFVEPTLQKVKVSLDRLADDPDMARLRTLLTYVF